MKRKVKFQEGGAVEEPARRSAIRNEPVGAGLRRLFAARPVGPRGPVNREVGGPREQEDRARLAAEAAAQFDAEERALAERRAAQRAALTNQPSRITNRPIGGAMFGGPAAPMPAPAAAPAPAVRRAMDAEGSEAAADAERRRQEANRPRPRPRPVAPREISADRLNELAMGAEPANPEERIAQMRIMQRRREMEEASPRTERPAPAPARAESMGGSGNIGAASARERGEQVGPPGQYNMKKGGKVPAPKAVVKKKAGGMIGKPKAAPKKMMKGGIVAKPKSKAKPMPFKKGGAIKKGRK